MFERKKATQETNKNETSAVDEEIEAYKKLQEQARDEETLSEELVAELENLMAKKAKVYCDLT